MQPIRRLVILVCALAAPFAGCAEQPLDTSELEEVPETAQEIGSSAAALVVRPSCDAGLRIMLFGATLAAIQMAQEANDSFINHPNSQRRINWFGPQHPTIDFAMALILNNVWNRFQTGDVTYDCDGNNPSCLVPHQFTARAQDTNTVRLCAPFWWLPATGPESMASVLLHEFVHHANVEGEIGGTAEAHNLALTDPSAAVNNAYNWEYFYANVTP